jgi:broad specificity phosphatase PhoE
VYVYLSVCYNALYAWWSDTNCRLQVMARAETALDSLVKLAMQSETRSVAAIAHSTYLKMLLALVQEASLLQTSALQLSNCCINVIDFERDRMRVSGKSMLFGGILSQAPDEYTLEMPKGEVVRLNEKRHLDNIVVQQPLVHNS